jgi:hypothetical protein
MQFLKDRKRQEVKEVFKTSNEFTEYLVNINNKINFESQLITEKINLIYQDMLTQDGLIKWVRFNRWLPSKFGFKKSNLLTLDFWLERGWSKEYGKNKISNITKERSNIGVKTKLNEKNKIEFNESIKIIFKGGEFISNRRPKCNICGEDLILTKKNIKNISDLFYYKITGCSNKFCETKGYSKSNLYNAYLPKDIAEVKLKELSDVIVKSNRLCVDSWVSKGYSEEEAKSNISKIQSKNSMMVKDRFVVSKDNLQKLGYSEEEINKICQTPSQVKFWVDKGYSEEDAKIMVVNNQLNALKHIDYESRLLPSNISYWVNRGFTYQQSKEKVTERQTTFSLEICLQKYGEKDGLKRFNERQNKWLTNYKRTNFSKISQQLFWGILETEPSIKNDNIFFATFNKGDIDDSGKNNEYRLSLLNGVILPDFIDLVKGKIIEFDGTYYHRSTPENSLREEKRDKMILESGYQVLHISEYDYKNNKQEIINKCIVFLNEK